MVTAIRAVAPPGGWTMSNAIITEIDAATAIAAANQVGPIRWTIDTPIKADRTCPDNTLRGRAALEPGMANNITADAPRDAMNNGAPNSNESTDTAMIATKEPVTRMTSGILFSKDMVHRKTEGYKNGEFRRRNHVSMRKPSMFMYHG